MAPDLTNRIMRRHAYIRIAWKRVRPGSGSSIEMLRSRTWRRSVFPLKSIVKTPFVVVGGVATRLYAPERMTDDLDVLIAAEDAGRFYGELQQGGSQQQGRLSIGGTHWQLPDNTLLDVLETAEPWIRRALAEAIVAPDGLPIIGLEYLVLLKLRAGRVTDIGDVSRMLGGADESILTLVRATVQAYQPDDLEDLESLIELGRLEYQDGQQDG